MPTLKVNVIEAQNLLGADIGGSSDPYCSIKIGCNNQFSSIEKTRKIKNTKNPTWKETFTLPVNNPLNEQLYIEVFNKEKMGKDDSLGYANVPLNDLARGVEKQVWLQLEGGTQGGNIIGQIASHLGKKKGHPTNNGRVLLGLTAMDFGMDPTTHQQAMGMQPQQGGAFPQQQQQQPGSEFQQQQPGYQQQQPGYQQQPGSEFQQQQQQPGYQQGIQQPGQENLQPGTQPQQSSGGSYQPGMPTFQQQQQPGYQQGSEFQQQQQPGYQQGIQQPGVSTGQEFSGQSAQSGVSGQQYQPSLSSTVPPQQQVNPPPQQTVYPPNL